MAAIEDYCIGSSDLPLDMRMAVVVKQANPFAISSFSACLSKGRDISLGQQLAAAGASQDVPRIVM